MYDGAGCAPTETRGRVDLDAQAAWLRVFREMPKPSTAWRIGVVAAICAGASWNGGCGCTESPRAATNGLPTDGAAVTGSAGDAQGEGVVIAAAGDIACGGCAQGATADLLDDLLQTD